MLPSTTVVGVTFMIFSNIRYNIFCHKPFKAFLESQVSEDKPIWLFTIKKLLF